MRPAYPKKLVVSEVSEGFRIVLETGEHFPRDEKQYYLAKNAEELIVFLMGVYNWEPEKMDSNLKLFCPACDRECPAKETFFQFAGIGHPIYVCENCGHKFDADWRRTDKDT